MVTVAGDGRELIVGEVVGVRRCDEPRDASRRPPPLYIVQVTGARHP